MLIDLQATNIKEDLVIQLPYMKFENNNVTVSELFIEFKEPVQIFGFITSTLVDRNPFNPKQVIFKFCQEQASRYLHRTPTHFQTYKIQRVELETAEFQIHVSEEAKLEKIKQLFIQLKITDAGIQQRPEQSIQ